MFYLKYLAVLLRPVINRTPIRNHSHSPTPTHIQPKHSHSPIITHTRTHLPTSSQNIHTHSKPLIPNHIKFRLTNTHPYPAKIITLTNTHQQSAKKSHPSTTIYIQSKRVTQPHSSTPSQKQVTLTNTHPHTQPKNSHPPLHPPISSQKKSHSSIFIIIHPHPPTFSQKKVTHMLDHCVGGRLHAFVREFLGRCFIGLLLSKYLKMLLL